MRYAGSRAALVLLCVLSVLCLFQSTAFAAAKTPPSIDDIVGTYAVKVTATRYDFGVTTASKPNETVTWDISPIDTDTVQVHVAEWGDWVFTAYYSHGFFYFGNGDNGENPDPAVYMKTGYALFSGTPGKIKMSGEMLFDFMDEQWCEYDRMSGKMTAVGTMSVSAADEKAAPPVDAITAASVYLPAIGELEGNWTASLSTIAFEPGSTTKSKRTESWTVTVVSPTTLDIETPLETLRAFYDETSGLLLVARLDDNTLANNSLLQLFKVSGKPGKLSLKGQFIVMIDRAEPDMQCITCKFSAKQIPE